MTDASHYQASLAGEKVPLHADVPRVGYYWLRRHKNAVRLPVCIWVDPSSDQLVARVGADMDDPATIWTYCAKNPVAKADALFAFENGRWRDEAPAPAGDNQPPSDDPLETITRELEAESGRVEAWIAENHEGASAANMAANWLTSLRVLEKKTVAAFDTEKAPILAEQKRIDTRWRPAKDLAAALKRRMDECYQAIGRKEKARLQAIAEAKAREEADKRRYEYEAEQAKLRELATEHGIPADEVPAPVEVPVEVAPVRVAFGGATGSRIGIRAVPPKALVEDWEKVAVYYARNAKVKELLQKLADHAVKDGHEVPGVRVIPGE
jgi:hypothetical protein